MTIGREHSLSREIYIHACSIESEGMDSGCLIELAKVLADKDVATVEELKDKLK